MTRRDDIPLAWVLTGWLLAAALIALNRGVDLLWGMVILLASALAAGFLLPWWQVLGLRIQRLAFPASGTVGQVMTLQYRIDAPAWPARHAIEICEALSRDGTFVPLAYLPEVSGRRELQMAFEPTTRGVFELCDIVIESRYPLGLSVRRRRLAAPSQRVTIYPDSVPLSQLPVDGQAAVSQEHFTSRRRGGSEEFFALRSWRAGDEPRAVHWRTSARIGELVTREYERQQDMRLWIVLEQFEDRHLGTGARSTFEYMVRIAHSVALKAREQGIPVGLSCRIGGEPLRIDPGPDHGTYLRIREALAQVNPDSGPPVRQARELDALQTTGGSWLTFNLAGNEERNALLVRAGQVGARIVMVELDVSSFTQAPGHQPGRVVNQATPYGWLATVPCDGDLTELFRPS